MATSNMGIQKIAQLIVVSEQVGRYMLCAALVLILASSVFAAPTVTVTASAQSILGTTQTVSMTVTLIDPNTTGMLKAGAVVVTNFTATSANATTVSVGPIYGNDVIADGFGNLNQTYYKIQVFPVSNGIIASTPALQNFYAFIGSGTIDVSSATPLSPSFQTGTSGNVVLPGTLTVSGLITASGGVTATTVAASGQISSTMATGTPPLSVASATPVTTLVVAQHPRASNCGSLPNNGTCAAFNPVNAGGIAFGDVILAAGTSTVSALPFTSNTTFRCTATDASATNAVKVQNISGTQITITGTGTDTISFICAGN